MKKECWNFPTFPQEILAWPPLIGCGQIWTHLAVACFQIIWFLLCQQAGKLKRSKIKKIEWLVNDGDDGDDG